MSNKKILHLITGLEVGGAEMMLLKTLPRLQSDFDNRVCCIRGHGPIGKRLEEAGIPVFYLNLKPPLDIGIIFRFRKIVREFQPEILVTYLIHADLFGRIFGRLFGITKIVCSVRVKLIQLKYLPLLLADIMTSPLVTHYHFNSHAVADMYRKYFFFPDKKITVIPNGLEIEKYQQKINVAAKREELGIPENRLVIGSVGRLEKQKGQKYLIKAFSEIVKTHPETFLILIGDGSMRKSLETLSSKLGLLGSVRFLGKRNDIPEILQVMDIFVLPSLYEGMSNALMEAMTVGIPIVATDIPENQELIATEKTGLLIPPKSSQLLAATMKRILADTDMAVSLKENAKRKASQQFDIIGIIRQYRKLYSR